MMPEIVIHPHSGFCFGVKKAVEQAEELVKKNDTTYCLGEIVHNPLELKRLWNKGLNYIGHDQFDKLKQETVMIRAHGEPPETFASARRNRLRLVDATCPIVTSLQKKIREACDRAERVGGTVYIYGRKDHPEVTALIGQSSNRAVVLSGTDELEAVDTGAPVWLFSQTTGDPDQYRVLADLLKEKIRARGLDPETQLHFYDSICSHVSNRKPEIVDFARRYELILFVSGRKSANGRMLFEHCREANRNSHFISGPAELSAIDLSGCKTIGICGATSTPFWLMEKVAEEVKHKAKLTGADE